MSVNEKQIGGNHYKGNGEFQHWDVVTALNWDYLLGAATKYLWRLGRKGDLKKSIEDIDKAIHYLEKKRELMYQEWASTPKEGPMAPGTLVQVDEHNLPYMNALYQNLEEAKAKRAALHKK